MYENTPIVMGQPTQEATPKQALTLNKGGSISYQDSATPRSATFSPAAGSANQSLVTIQMVDDAGNAVPGVFNFDWWLSDAANGAGLTATTASGAVGAGASGVDVGTYTAKKAGRSQTSTTGKYILAITDSANTGFYVCVAIPGRGVTVVSPQLVGANY